MRINLYTEELTTDVELVRKDGVIGEDGKPTTFYGVRFYLESSPKMHQTEHDDDRSAVTIWFRDALIERRLVQELLRRGLDVLNLLPSMQK